MTKCEWHPPDPRIIGLSKRTKEHISAKQDYSYPIHRICQASCTLTQSRTCRADTHTRSPGKHFAHLCHCYMKKNTHVTYSTATLRIWISPISQIASPRKNSTFRRAEKSASTMSCQLLEITLLPKWFCCLTLSFFRAAKFSNVTSITLFFPASQGDDTTRVYYVGFIGQYSEVRPGQAVLLVFSSPLNFFDVAPFGTCYHCV